MVLKNKDKIEISDRLIELEQERDNNITRNCNTMIISNSITLIPLLYVFIEVLNKIPQVRLLTIIFGLILVGLLLVGSFLSILANQFNKSIYIDLNDNTDFLIEKIYEKKCKNNNKRKNLLLASQMCSYAFFVSLATFILVIMIMM